MACVLLLPGLSAAGEISYEEYRQARSVAQFADLVYHGDVAAEWIEDTDWFWYSVSTRKGQEYLLVNATERSRAPAFDQEELGRLLYELSGETYDPYALDLKELSFSTDRKTMDFVLDSVKYRLNREDMDLEKTGRVQARSRPRRHWGTLDDERGRPPVISPDSLWVAFIRDFNVFVRNRENGEEHQLSFDGSDGDYYSSLLRWSPDASFLAVNQIRPHTVRNMYLLESSPREQLQPILHTYEYLRPGDALPVRKPTLFCISSLELIPLDTRAFEELQFRIGAPAWWEDSRGFTFDFNQRGHQAYQLVEVAAPSGEVRVLIDERSDTFIHYRWIFRHDLDDGREILWMSERDGWRHLYRYDGITGKLKNQVTRGEWVVRGVDHVNEEEGYVVFHASGRHEGRDPYLLKYYRVNLDGSGLRELTPEDGNHRAVFSKDYRFFVNTYSRVDTPPVSLLRLTETGEVLKTLETADITDLQEAGWMPPEVFTAKGRDGETDIWGIICRPTHFDPSKSYPVIEYIYAGPHNSYVPKDFTPYFPRFSTMNELGFIVVRIDGMGTANRSKAFHDVIWQNLKDSGFPDRKLWMQAAAEKYPYMDLDRVGIFGGSAGGQSALWALLEHADFYKAAVSAVGCHDNRMDKMGWNEQYMGYPIGPQYEANSTVVHAHQLQGRLMLTVGELDDNVDPASTMQVVNALIKANKDFELMVFPGYRHGFGNEYGKRLKRDFFVRHLLGKRPPDWNTVDYEEATAPD